MSETGNGEVILAPTVGAEFSGSSLPLGWESGPWTGGTALVGGGTVTVDGAWARTTATFAPGRALEFVATFSGASFQNAGLGQALASGSESWAMFGTDGTANLLRVRVNNAGATSQFDLGSTYLNAPHRYRIEWDAAQIRFLVDGTLVHTANVTIGANLRPIASDYNTGGGALVVDWMRMTPYAAGRHLRLAGLRRRLDGRLAVARLAGPDARGHHAHPQRAQRRQPDPRRRRLERLDDGRLLRRRHRPHGPLRPVPGSSSRAAATATPASTTSPCGGAEAEAAAGHPPVPH